MPVMKIFLTILSIWCLGGGAISAVIAGKDWIEKDEVSSVPFVFGMFTFVLGFIFLALAFKVVFSFT